VNCSNGRLTFSFMIWI